MSAEDGSEILQFGDGEYCFRLAFGQWRELQEVVNGPRIAMGGPTVGPRELLELVGSGNCWPHELREVIRLGLIGGGMKNDRALVLVKRFVEVNGWARLVGLAAKILARSMVGPPDDPVGKESPPDRPESPAREINESGFLSSTESVLQ